MQFRGMGNAQDNGENPIQHIHFTRCCDSTCNQKTSLSTSFFSFHFENVMVLT